MKKENKFNDVQKLIQFIDDTEKNYSFSDKLILDGNEIDLLKLIRTYKLRPPKKKENSNGESVVSSYDLFKKFVEPSFNSYIIGPESVYKNRIIKLNIHGKSVEIHYSPKAKKIKSFTSNIISKLEQSNYVVLDIETTGLYPLADDIIEICILKSETDFYHRLLPLKKRKTNTAYEINKIDSEELKSCLPLTQAEVDNIIEKFDLLNTPIVIWSGNNYFDRLFLEVYFIEHNLKGLDKLTFFNARSYLKQLLPEYKYAPKDLVASLYGIDVYNRHNAVADCIIEKKIVDNLLNNNLTPLQEDKTIKIKKFFQSSDINKGVAEQLYDEFCAFLIYKNGNVQQNYDEQHYTYGREWKDIHHIDEKYLDDIATRTNIALKNNDLDELQKLKPYNKKERLVFATKVEHFLLHCLLNLMFGGLCGGPHYLFGDLLKMQIGKFEEGTKENYIMKQQDMFYKSMTFDDIINIYCTILKNSKTNLSVCVNDFYKLDSYDWDNNKLNSIMQRIEETL